MLTNDAWVRPFVVQKYSLVKVFEVIYTIVNVNYIIFSFPNQLGGIVSQVNLQLFSSISLSTPV